MTALHAWENSDILAATGKAGMDRTPGEKFWTWRRIVLAVGYGLVFIDGLLILMAADPTGAVLMLAALAGFVFLHRAWVGIVVWIYVAVSGAVAMFSGDDLGFYGVVAGLGFGALATPWPKRRPRPAPTYSWNQNPFPPLPPQSTQQTDMPTATAAESVAPPAPMIRTIGRVQISTSSGDLTADLIGRPVIGFLWLYLLARQVRKPGDRLTRESLIDEVAYGVKDPRVRMRGYLRDVARLPEPLGSMIKVEDELIGFDLNGHETDVVELQRLADQARQAKGAIGEADLSSAQSLLLQVGDGEFLPGFEEMERRVTKGRGVAGEVVREVRAQVDKLRADLADFVANALLDHGRASEAVSLLEPIAARSEDRDDIARTLINALRESGQHSRAAEVRRRHAVGQES